MSKVKGCIEYSARIPGDAGNYRWVVRIDVSDAGYVGISQEQDNGELVRVLLAPNQIRALLAFLPKPKKKVTR